MKKIYLKCIPFIAILSLCVSCKTYASIRKVSVLTDYMANSNLKYYIRPQRFESESYKQDKAYLMLDFTYQMKDRDYVSDAFTNFSLYYKTTAYIKSANFILKDGSVVALKNITLLDRDAKKSYLRISTILEKDSIKTVLNELCYNNAALELSLDDGTTIRFFPNEEAKTKISNAFSM